NNCEKVLLDVWYSKNKSFVFDNNLYPDKLKNQMGRVLKLATMHYVPYNIIEGFTPEEYKGTESSALKLFAQEVNTTYKFLNNNNEEERWGDIYENWTGDGLLGLVVDDTVDFTFSAMGPWGQLHPYVDFSVTFERSGITCIVPAPTSTELTNKSFGNSILAMVKIFLVQCVDDADSPPGRYGALFMGLLFMYSLFLSSTYSSGLAAVMTLPRYNHPIETVQDLLDSGIPWVAPHEIWIFSISHSEVPIFKAIINAFLAEPSEEKLQDFSKTRDYTFAVERLPQATFAFPIDIHDDVIENFRVLKEDLYFEQLVVIARKSSVILPVLNKYLLRFCELGLIDHWQNEAVLLFGNPHMSRAILSNAKTATVGKLKWTHVEGAFGVLIFGQLIGLLVFIFEIGEARYKREKDIYTIS
ncbi:Ionotropic receptor 41a.3, partial [Diabrotica virgifera virgifera]